MGDTDARPRFMLSQATDARYHPVEWVYTGQAGCTGMNDVSVVMPVPGSSVPESAHPNLSTQARAWPSAGVVRPQWLGQSGLHRWPYGHLLLDGQRRIVDLNQTAQRMLEHADALKAVDGRLAACRESDHAALEAAWADESAAHWVTVRRPRGAPLRVRFRRSAPDCPADGDEGAIRVVADVIDLQPRDQDIEDILSFIGGLTPAQRRIVAHLLRGDSVTEAAQQLGLSVNTVKSHLSQVFRRTGVSRVADLILLYVMPFVMLPEP